jgi:hypothetical protein
MLNVEIKINNCDVNTLKYARKIEIKSTAHCTTQRTFSNGYDY